MHFLYRLLCNSIILLAVLLSVQITFPGIARSMRSHSTSDSTAPHTGIATQLPISSSGYELLRAFPNVQVERPTSVVIPPDGKGRLFLVQQRGKVLILPKDENAHETECFLDISDRGLVTEQGEFEMGLLGLAFHPQFAENGKFYFNSTRGDALRTVISEMQVSKVDPSKADVSTERILIEQQQPFWNHNSGNVTFGPDGYLYLTLGDGGKRDDPLRTAQNLFELLGKVLRIDVNHAQGGRPYGIPADNPFASTEGARPEIWAYGFRNPWGISFDPEGRLWVADVGQDVWEEVNVVEKGGNYGWSHREGARPFPLRTDPPPAEAKFIDPVFEYPHSEGISVTGGFVYRGEKLPKLKGAYLCADWGLGRIWALWLDKATGKLAKVEKIFDSPADWKGRGIMKPTAICEDAAREVLVLDWSGAIFRLASVE